jgi:hypothetical protein
MRDLTKTHKGVSAMSNPREGSEKKENPDNKANPNSEFCCSHEGCTNDREMNHAFCKEHNPYQKG